MKAKPSVKSATPQATSSTPSVDVPRAQRKIKKVRAPRINAAALDGLERINHHAAGIDVGGAQNYVCVPANSVPAGQPTVRAFGVFTSELDATVAWLKECGITTVAMEATGIYWMALYDKLEALAIEVVLVEPHSVKQVPGRKSDVVDCQWLQQLHTYGLLRGSFRPDEPIRRLRTLTRQRLEIVQGAAASQQHMQHALVPMNLQLHLVVSDVVGETGLRIIESILNGEHDPEVLVKLRDQRCKKSTIAEMKAALNGHYTDEGLFVLGQSLEAWKFYQQQLEQCDKQIERVIAQMPTARPATQARCGRARAICSKSAEKEGRRRQQRSERGYGKFGRTRTTTLRGKPHGSVRTQSPKRPDAHCRDWGGYESLAQCQSVLFLAGTLPGFKNQRGSRLESSDPQGRQSSQRDPAHGGAGDWTNRYLAGAFLSAQEGALGSTQSDHRHGTKAGLCRLSPAEISRELCAAGRYDL